MSDDVLDFIRAQAQEVLDADPKTITRTTSLAEEYDADSVDVIEIASAVEHKFGVTIEDHEVYELTCVGDFVDLVDKKRKAKPAGDAGAAAGDDAAGASAGDDAADDAPAAEAPSDAPEADG